MKDKRFSIIIIIFVSITIFIISAIFCILTSILKDESKDKSIIDDMVFETPISDENKKNITRIENDYRGDYKNIYDIEYSYTIVKAIEDNNYVKVHMDSYNDEIYENFIEKYNNNETVFLRTVKVTIEGALIVEDYIYDDAQDVIYAISDTTRDTFMSDEDRNISAKEYDSPKENEEWNNILEYIK